MSNPSDTSTQLATSATDLLEHEIQKVGEIIYAVQLKYQYRANNAQNLEAMRDELLTRLADIGILANVDPTPALYGEPPICDIVGKVGDPGFKKEFDHEQKGYEVRKANARGEAFLGQKGEANSTKAKKRDRKSRKR